MKIIILDKKKKKKTHCTCFDEASNHIIYKKSWA